MSAIVLPFEMILTYYIIRTFKPRTTPATFYIITAALVLDCIAIIWHSLFPLASMLIIIAIKLYYGRHIWKTIGVVFAINSGLFAFFVQLPNGHYFATAVNYYISYAIIHTLTLNEIYIKRILLIATVKHLILTGSGRIFSKDIDEKMVFATSIAIVYYMVKAALYYREQYDTKETVSKKT
jgi:hypothetical protein